MRYSLSSRWGRVGIALSVLVLLPALEPALRGGDEPPSLRSYYIEALISIEPRDPLDEPAITRLRAWYEAPDKWRREYGYTDPLFSDLTTVHVSDGETASYLEGGANVYDEQPLTEALREAGSVISIASASGHTRRHRPALDRPAPRPAFYGITDDELLGRAVKVLDLVRSDGDTVKLWFDPNYNFILAAESVQAGPRRSPQTVRAESTSSTMIGSRRGCFASSRHRARAESMPRPNRGPAPRSVSRTVAGPSAGASLQSRRAILFQPIFLKASSRPARARRRCRIALCHGSRHGCSPKGSVTTLSSPSQSASSTRRRPATVARSGTPSRVAQATAYRTEIDVVRRIVWHQNEIVVTLTSSTLLFEELQRIAESMR